MAYPRLYRLHAVIKLPDQDAAAAEVSMWHLQTLRSQPAATEFTCPPYPQPLPLAAAKSEHPAVDREGDGVTPPKGAEASGTPVHDVPAPSSLPDKVSVPTFTECAVPQCLHQHVSCL